MPNFTATKSLTWSFVAFRSGPAVWVIGYMELVPVCAKFEGKERFFNTNLGNGFYSSINIINAEGSGNIFNNVPSSPLNLFPKLTPRLNHCCWEEKLVEPVMTAFASTPSLAYY
jgi:hypothetical protein